MNLPDPQLVALAAGLLPLRAVLAATVRRIKPAEARCAACGRPVHDGPSCGR